MCYKLSRSQFFPLYESPSIITTKSCWSSVAGYCTLAVVVEGAIISEGTYILGGVLVPVWSVQETSLVVSMCSHRVVPVTDGTISIISGTKSVFGTVSGTVFVSGTVLPSSRFSSRKLSSVLVSTVSGTKSVSGTVSGSVIVSGTVTPHSRCLVVEAQ